MCIVESIILSEKFIFKIKNQARYAEMNRKQKERMEKEKLQDQEDSKKASHNNDLGRFQFPFR